MMMSAADYGALVATGPKVNETGLQRVADASQPTQGKKSLNLLKSIGGGENPRA